jgi:hypothetical protein
LSTSVILYTLLLQTLVHILNNYWEQSLMSIFNMYSYSKCIIVDFIGTKTLIKGEINPTKQQLILHVCIDLVHHEALSVTHRWSHFNYSPLTSNQSMINYMYGLLTMIMKITHIVEERLIICFQRVIEVWSPVGYRQCFMMYKIYTDIKRRGFGSHELD